MKSFRPDWFEGELPPRSFRSIFKWGHPREYKHPNRRLYAEMKRVFRMTDDDFREKRKLGLGEVPETGHPSALATTDVEALVSLVGGPENARSDVYSRLAVSYGKTMGDLTRLRDGIVENLPDLVLHPRSRADLRAVVDYCDAKRIPVYVYCGGSSVTRGTEALKGGVTLDTRVHLKRVLELNETDGTVTVEAGLQGPELERFLQNAPELLGAKERYTLGHFPQSFEYSGVGGWVVTRGAGQNSTYYGKIEDMVAGLDWVCPSCDLVTEPFPRRATGPDLDQLMIGSEGAYGVLYSATLKLRRFEAKATRRMAFVFRNFEGAMAAAREVMRGEFGMPSVFRLSDPEETDIALKLYGVEGTPVDWGLSLLGYRRGERCLLVASADGDRSSTRLIKRKIMGIALRRGAFYATGFVEKAWEHGRFRDPYLRESLQDFGVMTDTLECAVTWSRLERVRAELRKAVHARPDAICMIHASHFYPQGCNLYAIFIARLDSLAEYKAYQASILDAVQRSGAALSHHHGIGKSFAPWLEGQVGKAAVDTFRALKKRFDPNNVMNPGGTLALDLPDGERRFERNFDAERAGKKG